MTTASPVSSTALQQVWDAEFLGRSPMFQPLQAVGRKLAGQRSNWPALKDYQALLDNQPVATASGHPLRFVPQNPSPGEFTERYEPRIYLTGEAQTRLENWHDLFNALVWLTFPLSKAALNARHHMAQVQAMGADQKPHRSATQDSLTLFDESGVIVACSDEELSGLLQGRKWKELFWNRRHELPNAMGFFLFGHSLYEKALHPYSGMTGKSLIVPVTANFFEQSLATQISELDSSIAERLGTPESFQSPKELAPLPVLGVPGWTPDNAAATYYEDTRYFRPAPTMPR
jgi:hypothetical protein